MNEQLKVYYLRGWIRPVAMQNPEWFTSMYERAQEAITEKMELVVFAIPANTIGTADPDTIAEIEKLIQKRFGIPK